jgi:hypothetical protein
LVIFRSETEGLAEDLSLISELLMQTHCNNKCKLLAISDSFFDIDSESLRSAGSEEIRCEPTRHTVGL